MQRHTFRDISLFVAAYEARSFTAAALRENSTQSGVSQHIRKLEEGYGVRLFERTGTSIVPTPAGDIYYRHCIEILRASSQAVDSLLGHGRGTTGTLNVGLMPTVTRFCLAGPLHRMIEENPNARIRVIDGFSADLTDRVLNGDLAFAIVPGTPAVSESGLLTTPFLTTPECVVCGPASALFGSPAVSPDDLRDVSLVVPTERNVRRHEIEAFLARHRLQPRRLLELDSMMGTLDILRRTEFVALLPALMVVRELQARGPLGELHVPRRQDIDMRTRLVIIERARDSVSALGERLLTLLHEECETLLTNVDMWHVS